MESAGALPRPSKVLCWLPTVHVSVFLQIAVASLEPPHVYGHEQVLPLNPAVPSTQAKS